MSRLRFAHELIERSKNRLAFLDFETPIIDSLFSTLYTNDQQFKMDFFNPTTWLSNIPFSNVITLEDWVEKQRINFRLTLGLDILARILLRDYRENDWQSLWPTLIIRDFDELADLKTIQSAYGLDSCHNIILEAYDKNAQLPRGCNSTWLPLSTPTEQADKFLRCWK